MRITWIEALCIAAIAVATLQLPVSERTARLFAPPRTSFVEQMWAALTAAFAGRASTPQERRRSTR
jgi:hypothetical protein